MKNLSKLIIAAALALVAKAVVRRYEPHIVMVTGSVGKTSTKDAVAAVLATRFFVRSSEKSFNSEFGVPFTILGSKNPWGKPFEWISVMKRSLALLLLPNHYPNMLVLEVGADRPGDLAQILRIATPDAVVLTRLPEVPVHVEAYASPDEVREEEFSPAYALKNGEPLILSADDPYALDSAVRTSARIISYGTSENSMVRVSNIGFYEAEGKVAGMQARISTNGQQGDLIVKGSVGATQLLPEAAAVALGSAFDIPLPAALKALEGYKPPPGRGRLLAGVKDSTIIDDSYNASPVAVEEALATLKKFPLPAGGQGTSGRRIAVLGDMLELGRYSAVEHDRIGALAKDSADIVAAIGVRARAFAGAKGDTEVMLFNTARAAAETLSALIRKDDVILVKGSQSMRTERVVEALLAHPSDAALLVRQEREWRRKS